MAQNETPSLCGRGLTTLKTLDIIACL